MSYLTDSENKNESIRYERYEEVPAEAAQKIIEEAKKNAEEEE